VHGIRERISGSRFPPPLMALFMNTSNPVKPAIRIHTKAVQKETSFLVHSMPIDVL
jgi:hypothetical protein